MLNVPCVARAFINSEGLVDIHGQARGTFTTR
jgi:hypothetical protein